MCSMINMSVEDGPTQAMSASSRRLDYSQPHYQSHTLSSISHRYQRCTNLFLHKSSLSPEKAIVTSQKYIVYSKRHRLDFLDAQHNINFQHNINLTILG